MAEKIESWRSDDGLIWPTQMECVTHEVAKDLFARVPGLKDRDAIVRQNLDSIAKALLPYCDLFFRPDRESIEQYHARIDPPLAPARTTELISAENHPDIPAENHPDDFSWHNSEDVGCDCGALLAGNSGAPHTDTCSLIVERNRA